jgi:hypothetical protein
VPLTRKGFTTAPFFVRMIEAMFLRRELYERIAADRDGWRQAAGVVCLTALAYSALMRWTPYLEVLVAAMRNWVLLLVMLFGLVRWGVSTALVYGFALLFARERADFRKLLRCIGFAQAPALAAVFAFVLEEPILGWLPLVIGLWLLVTTVAAVRYALGIGTGRAAVIGGLGFAADAALPAVVGFIAVVLTS